MQLDRLVNFHKAVGDPTRIRILSLLAKGPLHGQALAGKLGLTPPTITHHLTKLREVGLVKERRDKNTVYFLLDEPAMQHYSGALLDVVFKQAENGEDAMEEKSYKDKEDVLKNFFTPDGKLKQIPAQRKKKLIVFEHLLKGLDKRKKYTEREISEYIKQYHDDYATIRREFIVNHYMYRENGIYEFNPPEMWAKIE